jgi:hypothetical protein
MATTAWPYAVTRGENSGYQAIMVPGFLQSAGQGYVLEYASKQETDEPDTVTVRDVLGAAPGPLSLAYRVGPARADRYGLDGSTLLEDAAGRAIRVFEGLVLRLPAEKVPSIGLTAADLDAVTQATIPAFRKLWTAGTHIDAEPSTAIPIGGTEPSRRPLQFQVVEPYVVPGNGEPTGALARGTRHGVRKPSSSLRPPRDRTAELPRSSLRPLVSGVVVVGLLAALLTWFLTRPTGPSATAAAIKAAVKQTCSELKSGDVSRVYREFSGGYRQATDLTTFESRLLGSNASATCTSTSTTGDEAVLSLRLADGATRTADMDFQSESGQWQVTAMTVSS